jgi:hypothetical protein
MRLDNVCDISNDENLDHDMASCNTDDGMFMAKRVCTWSLTLREEHRLRVFESRVRRRIFGPKRDEVTGGWRKLHNEELHDLYSSPSIVKVINARRMRWAGHVARMGEVRNAYTILVGKPEGRRPLENLRVDVRITLRLIFGK